MKRESQKETLIKELKKQPVIQIACTKADISRATFYRWKKEDPEFANQVDKAMEEGNSLISDMAETQLISAIRDKNFNAISFWLKHHHPTYTTRVEINAHLKEVRELTPEQQALIQEALRLAALPGLSEVAKLSEVPNQEKNNEQSNGNK